MPAEQAGPAPAGIFITVEGGDGAGKSTLARSLADCLRQTRVPPWSGVRLTFEPGGTPLGRSLRSLVLDPTLELSDWDETWLFLAARASHVHDVLRPARDNGEIVLSDRYIDSTLAYQGYGRGLDLKHLRRLNEDATSGLWPDLTLLLDISAEAGLRRARSRSTVADRIGEETLDFHRGVNEGFRQLAAAEPQRIRVIDAERSAEEVLRDALSIVGDWIASQRVGA